MGLAEPQKGVLTHFYALVLSQLCWLNKTEKFIKSRSNQSDLQASSGVLISASQYMHASGLCKCRFLLFTGALLY